MHWISVKDRLPEKKGCYIVYVILEDGELSSVTYFDKKFGFQAPVTHWMPMPEKPYEVD